MKTVRALLVCALAAIVPASSALAAVPISWSESDRPVSLLPQFNLFSTSDPVIDEDAIPSDEAEESPSRKHLKSCGWGCLGCLGGAVAGALVGAGVGWLIDQTSRASASGNALHTSGFPWDQPPLGSGFSITVDYAFSLGVLGGLIGGIAGSFYAYKRAREFYGFNNDARFQPPSLALEYQPTGTDSMALTLDLRLLTARF